MDLETKKNLELRKKIIDLGYGIAGEIDHGECFYEKNMLEAFCASLDEMKNLAREYFVSNRKEIDEDE
jgi:hypothetical protein